VSRRARPRGYDGAKKLVGPKRVAMVDADGRVLALAVVPANLQDRDTLPALDSGKPAWPSLRLAVFDAAFTAERCEEWGPLHGMRRRVVEKDPGQKGFVVLERRWVVERTCGWLSHGGGLQRERAGRLDVATGRLACLASLMAANALNNPA
jgi:putative transposase